MTTEDRSPQLEALSMERKKYERRMMEALSHLEDSIADMRAGRSNQGRGMARYAAEAEANRMAIEAIELAMRYAGESVGQ